MRVVNKPKLDGVFGVHVCVETARWGRALLRDEAYKLANYGADAVGPDNEVMFSFLAVPKGDGASVCVDIGTLV